MSQITVFSRKHLPTKLPLLPLSVILSSPRLCLNLGGVNPSFLQGVLPMQRQWNVHEKVWCGPAGTSFLYPWRSRHSMCAACHWPCKNPSQDCGVLWWHRHPSCFAALLQQGPSLSWSIYAYWALRKTQSHERGTYLCILSWKSLANWCQCAFLLYMPSLVVAIPVHSSRLGSILRSEFWLST